jgi:aldehyde:ferredoxin oxidoreductase
MGRCLRADLSTGAIRSEPLDKSRLRKYPGGPFLALRQLYDEVSAGTDAFDPENRLIVMSAPLVGTIAPAATQYAVLTKSPLTGLMGIARSKGFFGGELKFAGYDGIIIQGKSDEPVYLWIRNGEAELRDASHVWGKDTYQTEEIIRRETHDNGTRIACIGQAGEVLSRMACIMNDRGHAAARCGPGAVMGSKRLKAIAVRGSQRVPVVNEDALLSLRKKWLKISSESYNARSMAEYGTSGSYDRTEGRHSLGDLPTKNWTTAVFPDWKKLSGEYITSNYATRKATCYNCYVGHDKTVDIKSGQYAGCYAYPEYEDTAAFGCNLGVSDTEAIIKLTDLANRYGVDSIECSHTLSMVMECYERGIVAEENLDGMKLTWGNVPAIIEAMGRISRREGVGGILAEGVKRAADYFGAPELAVHIKNMSPVLHDLRHNWGWMISYVVAAGGPSHQGIGAGGVYTLDPDIDFPKESGPFTPRHKGEAAKKAHIKWLGLDCLGTCVLAALDVPLKLQVEMLCAVTGWNVDLQEFIQTVYRGVNLARAFDIRHGLRPEDEWPSERILEAPSDGAAQGMTARKALRAMLNDYYHEMGWDPRSGKPWRSTLTSLGLEDVADDIWA